MSNMNSSGKIKNSMVGKFYSRSKFNRIFVSYTIFTFVFLILSMVVKVLSGPAFLVISTLALLFIILLYKLTFELLGFSKGFFHKNEYIFIFFSIFSAFLIFIYYLYTQKTVKVWDYSVYWTYAITLEKKFNVSTLSGILSIGGSIFYSEYNKFLLIFTELPFKILGPSMTSFTLSYFFAGIIPIVIGFSVLSKLIIADVVNDTKHLPSFILCSIALISFPLLYAAALKGMPDVFGLVFVSIILICSYKYDFSGIELKRLVVLGLSLICLMLVRRWYAFWIVGYFTSVLFCCFVKYTYSRNFILLRKSIINIILFGTILFGIVIILFFPMVFKVATANYAKYYKGYMHGGFSSELGYQIRRLGIITLLLILFGIIHGIYNKSTRLFTLFSIINFLIPLFLFTRIQNMGDHQSLILVPSYISLSFIGMTSIYNSSKKYRYILTLLIAASLLLNFSNSMKFINLEFNHSLPLFSSMDIKPEIRKDLNDIKQIVDYIDNICDKDNKLYIVSGSGEYNVDIFRNFRMPDLSFADKIYTETSVDLTHGFPIHLFNTEYVLISDPLQYGMAVENSRVIQIIGDSIMHEKIINSHYSLIKDFKVGEDLKYHLYKLNTPLGDDAAEYYLKEFNKYYSNYPELFENRIKSLMKNK